MESISVFLTAYNRQMFLREAIESVLNQTYKNFKFIIINNGSTDDTEKIIKSYTDKRIIYIKIEKNINPIKVLDKWFSMADTKYIVWFHDDDIMDKNMLKKEYEVLERNKNCSSVSANAVFIKENGEYLGDVVKANLIENIVFKPMEYLEYAAEGSGDKNLPFAPSMYRTELMLNALKEIYSNNLYGPSCDDLLRYIMNKTHETILLKDKLYFIRVHSGRASADALYVTEDLYKNVCKYMDSVLPKDKAEKYKNKIKFRYISNISDELDNYILEKLNLKSDIASFIKEAEACGNLDDTYMVRFKRMSVQLLYMRKKFCGYETKNYYLYGSGSSSDKDKMIIDKFLPNMKCIGYIDNLRSGYKEGLPIIKSDEYDFINNATYIIISSSIAGYDIYKKLISIGKKELIDFIYGGGF